MIIPRPITLVYHDITVQGNNPWVMTPDLFKQHQTILNKYRNYVDISFDDGRLGCWHQRHLLFDYGFLPLFFICVDFAEDSHRVQQAERYTPFMHWSHIEDLISLGGYIGSHSFTHSHTGMMSDEQQMEELVESRLFIRNMLGVPVDAFAAPYGDMPNVSNIRSAGYTHAYSTVPRKNESDDFVQGRLVINSHIHSDLDTLEKDINDLILCQD